MQARVCARVFSITFLPQPSFRADNELHFWSCFCWLPQHPPLSKFPHNSYILFQNGCHFSILLFTSKLALIYVLPSFFGFIVHKCTYNNFSFFFPKINIIDMSCQLFVCVSDQHKTLCYFAHWAHFILTIYCYITFLFFNFYNFWKYS